MTPADRITVSVITPCYNGSRFLEQTLRSAAHQTFAPLEILVVDDGSTDDSAAIADRFGAPVRVIRQKNQGESVARNRALAEARGSHVLFLDADDLLGPRALQELAEALTGKANAVGLMGCAWFDQDPERPLFVNEASARAFYPGVIGQNIAPPHCWLTPTDLVRRAGGFCETMRWFEDWDLWWRVGLFAPTIEPVAYVGALYRQHAHSQLATTRAADRARGHAALVSRMARVILEQPSMLKEHGAALFWSVWSALAHARRVSVSWSELQDVTDALLALARQGPAEVRRSTSARMFRLVGVRAGFLVQQRTASTSALDAAQPPPQR